MIISGTITSAPVGPSGLTVTDPVDNNPPQGFVPVGNSNQWQAKPAGVGALANAQTVTNSFNVDFSQASVFQFSPNAGQTIWPLFVNQQANLYQTVRLIITQPTGGLSYVVWPAGTTFVGGTKTLSSVTAYVDMVDISAAGQSTFLGNMLLYVH